MAKINALARHRLRLPLKLALALFLIGLADWLFFGWDIGISVVIFFLALVGGAVVANPVHATARQFYTVCILFALSLLPMVDELNVVSFAFGAVGALVFLLVTGGAMQRVKGAWVNLVASTLLATPLRFFKDISTYSSQTKRQGVKTTISLVSFARCAFLILTGSAFVFLFSNGNQLIADALAKLETLLPSFENVSLERVGLWIFFLCVSWLFLGFALWRHNWIWKKSATQVKLPIKQQPEISVNLDFLSASLMRNALLMFNLIFAVQTVLDLVYLWGGRKSAGGDDLCSICASRI